MDKIIFSHGVYCSLGLLCVAFNGEGVHKKAALISKIKIEGNEIM